MAQLENNNIASGSDFAAKMDAILGAIQGYEGKEEAIAELVLEMQRKFNDKLEALEQDNNFFKAQFVRNVNLE